MRAISLTKKYIVAFIVVFMLPFSCLTQNHLADTMIIDFPLQDTLIEVNFPVNKIEDNRNQNDSLIKIEETHKFLILPVDLYIMSEKPLDSEINQMLGIDDLQEDKHFLLKLNEFSLEERQGNFFPAYVLYADVGLYRLNDQDTSFVGRFGYESEYPKKIFRSNKETGYERAIEAWKTPLINDLLTIKQNPSASDLQEDYHFTTRPYPEKSSFLYGAGRFSITNRAFLAEGEMMFSHRESKPLFKRAPYSIRYRKDDKFESLELGRGGDIINRRINDYWLAQARFNVYFGFNKWKNPRDDNHELWDLFILDYAFNQGIHFDKRNKSGLVMGIGLTEGIYYNYFSGIRLEFGGYVSFGIKL